MNTIKYLYTLSFLLLFNSCIQKEALNPECDILSLSPSFLQELKEKNILADGANILITNTAVDIPIKKIGDKRFSPSFLLTPGAIILPANGSEQDFSSPVSYTVISEDRAWQKKYKVRFIEPQLLSNAYHFENAELKENKYFAFYEDLQGEREYLWASGNPAFSFTGLGTKPEAYPTYQIKQGYQGKGVALQTRSTGLFGKATRKPIAAGNLFIGSFQLGKAISKPLEATQFGKVLHTQRPLSIQGYYLYEPGKEVINAHSEKLNHLTDSCDIFAVVFETDPQNFQPLNGDSIQTSSRIVLKATVPYLAPTKDWTAFNLSFIETDSIHKPFSYERLKEGGYAFTLVMTSSKRGAEFVGAIGSKLIVDEIKINYEKIP